MTDEAKPASEMTPTETQAEVRRLKALNPTVTLTAGQMWRLVAASALRGRQGEDPRELADAAVLVMEMQGAEMAAALPEHGDLS